MLEREFPYSSIVPSREELLKLPGCLWKRIVRSQFIEDMVAAYKVGVDGLERIGVGDKTIYEWLSDTTSNSYKDRFGGDVHSVLLAHGWTPARYAEVMIPAMPPNMADVFLESFRKKCNK